MKKNKLKLKVFFLFIFVCFFGFVKSSEADVSLPWSTTFNCNDWTQGEDLNCSGLGEGGGWTTPDGSLSKIILAANNPSGGGGKGIRFWDGYLKENQCSGTVLLTFDVQQTELWIRWYMRYENGYKWERINYNKLIYINTADTDAIPEFVGSNGLQIAAQGTANPNYVRTSTSGWESIYGTESDGSWICMEIHIKMDTDQTDGVGEMWLNGNLVISKDDVDWSSGDAASRNGWTRFSFDSNQEMPDNSRDMYVDYDDLAVSNTGYIGPILGDDDVTAPTSPRGLSVN